MTCYRRTWNRVIGLALVSALVGGIAASILTGMALPPVLPDGIVLCEVAGGIARCEMIAAEER